MHTKQDLRWEAAHIADSLSKALKAAAAAGPSWVMRVEAEKNIQDLRTYLDDIMEKLGRM